MSDYATVRQVFLDCGEHLVQIREKGFGKTYEFLALPYEAFWRPTPCFIEDLKKRENGKIVHLHSIECLILAGARDRYRLHTRFRIAKDSQSSLQYSTELYYYWFVDPSDLPLWIGKITPFGEQYLRGGLTPFGEQYLRGELTPLGFDPSDIIE